MGIYDDAYNEGHGDRRQRAQFKAVCVEAESHLHEPPEHDRAEGPEDDRQAELMERWYGWGEDWDSA